MELTRPKKLHQGDTIALIAPSSYCAPEDSANVKRELEKRGFRVTVHPQCHARDHMSAGTPQEKVAALHEVFSDPSIDAVFALRGGYQTLNMADRIDMDLMRRHPKILMGYSDITVLHGVLLKQASLVTFHGPNANGFGRLSNPESEADLQNSLAALDFLCGDVPQNLFRDHACHVLQDGTASGRIFCGNMQIICALIEAGEAYCPELDGVVLMIEDISEEIVKIERQFSSWRLRGIFQRLAGLVIGHMTDIKDTPGRAGVFGYTMEDVVRRHALDPAKGVKGPVVMQGPFGHEFPNYPFPQGVMAQLQADDGRAVFSLLESPFAG